MESQPQNPEFRINPEYFLPCINCGYSLEASQQDSSNEYPLHMLALRNEKKCEKNCKIFKTTCSI